MSAPTRAPETSASRPNRKRVVRRSKLRVTSGTVGPMLTEQEAFEAMRYFLTEFWKRGGSNSDSDLVDILSWTSSDVWEDRGTNDPAQWQDWLNAAGSPRRSARAAVQPGVGTEPSATACAFHAQQHSAGALPRKRPRERGSSSQAAL